LRRKNLREGQAEAQVVHGDPHVELTLELLVVSSCEKLPKVEAEKRSNRKLLLSVQTLHKEVREKRNAFLKKKSLHWKELRSQVKCWGKKSYKAGNFTHHPGRELRRTRTRIRLSNLPAKA